MPSPADRDHRGLAPRHVRVVPLEDGFAHRAVSIIVVGVVALALSFPRYLGPSFNEWLTWGAAAVVMGLVAAPPMSVARRVRVLALGPAVLVVAVLAWYALTALWSQQVQSTVNAVVTYAVITAVAWVAASRARPSDVPLGLAVGLVALVALSVWATWSGYDGPSTWTPWWGASEARPAFQGLYGNRNVLAYTIVILAPAVLALGALGAAAVPATVLLGVGIAVVVFLVRSTTGTVAVVAIVALAAVGASIRLARRGRPRRFARILPAVGLAGAVAALAGIVLIVIDALPRKTFDINGRTPLWESILRVSGERPVAGSGWGSVWAYHWMPAPENPVRDAINEPLLARLSHGHNGVLDLLPQVGWIGVTLVAAVQLWSALRLFRATPQPARTWGLLTLAAINVAGLTEPTWAVPLAWGAIVMVAVVASRLEPAPRTGARRAHRAEQRAQASSTAERQEPSHAAKL